MMTSEERNIRNTPKGGYWCRGCGKSHRRVEKASTQDYADRGFLPVDAKPTAEYPCGSYVVNGHLCYYVGYSRILGQKFVADASGYDGFPL